MKKQKPIKQSFIQDNKYLEPDDWYLWSKVSATISPLKNQKINKKNPLDNNNKTNSEVTIGFPKTLKRNYFAPSYTPNTQNISNIKQQAVSSIEPSIVRRVMRGHLPIDGTLDLHGMRQNEAHSALCRFIKARFERGNKTLLIITGKGDNKPLRNIDGFAQQGGVLRSMLPHWLNSMPLQTMVSGWQISTRKHGGEGAFYVRLRGDVSRGDVK